MRKEIEMHNHDHFEEDCPICMSKSIQKVKIFKFFMNSVGPHLTPPKHQREITVVPSSVQELIERGKV